MNDAKTLQMKQWVKCWQEAGPVLEKIKEAEIRNSDTIRSMEIFAGSLASILKKNPPLATSGMIEMQKIFSRGRK